MRVFPTFRGLPVCRSERHRRPASVIIGLCNPLNDRKIHSRGEGRGVFCRFLASTSRERMFGAFSMPIWSAHSILPRTAGSATRIALDEIGYALSGKAVPRELRGYFKELFEQFGVLELKLFHLGSAVTLYEMASAMIQCGVTRPQVVEWMNCNVTDHAPPARNHRTHWLESEGRRL